MCDMYFAFGLVGKRKKTRAMHIYILSEFLSMISYESIFACTHTSHRWASFAYRLATKEIIGTVVAALEIK